MHSRRVKVRACPGLWRTLGEEKERGRYRGWDRTGITDKGENRTDTTGKGWSKTGITDRGWSRTDITDREGRRCWRAGDGRCADSL